MNIEGIINEEVEQVNVDNLDLPENMQSVENQSFASSENNSTNEQLNNEATKLSLEQLSGMIIGAFDVVNKMVWKKVEPTFDASLTADEIKVIDEPLKLVLKSYEIEVTPPIALLIAVAGVEVGKFMQLKFYKAQMQMQMMQNSENTDFQEVEQPNEQQQ